LTATVLSACATQSVDNENQVSTSDSQKTKLCKDDQIARAAFDIGSSSTKLLVACVTVTNDANKNRYKIVTKLTQHKLSVGYGKDLIKGKGKFSPQIIFEGFMVLDFLYKKAKAYGATEFRGVTTHAFRNAKNNKKVVDLFNASFPIDIKLASQTLEGELELRAVADLLNKDLADIHLVWGIGSNSMQLTYASQEGLNAPMIHSFRGGFASETFIEAFCKKQTNCSSNKLDYPIEHSDIDSASAEAAKKAVKKIDAKVTGRSKNKKIYAVGGTIEHSPINKPPKKNLGPDQSKCFEFDGFTPAKAQCFFGELAEKKKQIINKLISYEDEGIDDKYLDSTVSNLVLINSYVKHLGPKIVKPTGVGVAEGILVSDGW
jgi:Ppx/GppA phosphatase family protein